MTQEEINRQINAKQAKVNDLLRRLNETDYVGIKIAEGAATKTEYAAKRAERQGWRDEINALRDEIEELEAMTPDDVEA